MFGMQLKLTLILLLQHNYFSDYMPSTAVLVQYFQRVVTDVSGHMLAERKIKQHYLRLQDCLLGFAAINLITSANPVFFRASAKMVLSVGN